MRGILMIAIAALTLAATVRADSAGAQIPPQLSLAVATDRPVYPPGAPITFTLSVTNPTDAPLLFPAGAIPPAFEVRAVATREVVWRFPCLPYPIPAGQTAIPPGTRMETHTWDQRRETGGPSTGRCMAGEQVPPGLYEVRGGLVGPSSQPARFRIGCPPGTTALGNGECSGETPPVVDIPGQAIVAPGRAVTFRRPSDGATLTVVYDAAPGPATLGYDGQTLTATVPALGAFESVELVGGDAPEAACARVPDRRNALRCAVQPAVDGTSLTIGTLYSDPVFPFTPRPGLGLAATRLVAGCTNVVISFPDGTLVAAVARSIIAPGVPLATRPAPEAVWKLDAARQRFLGWSPLPGAPSDFEQVNRFDAVFICTDRAAELVQPAPQ